MSARAARRGYASESKWKYCGSFKLLNHEEHQAHEEQQLSGGEVE
jgi:hypothetical protein